MIHRIVIHHLPTGKEFFSDAKEFSTADMHDLVDLLKMTCSGKTAYFSLIRDNTKMFVPAKILEESILKLEQISD